MLTPLILPRPASEAPTKTKRRVSKLASASRQYFLEVELEVLAANQERFVAGAVELLEPFREVGLHLVASAWRTSSDPVRVVNYWSIGSDADVLLEAELALPDLPTFNAFNALIHHEVKTIAIPIAANEQVPLPKDGDAKLASHRYLRVSMDVTPELLPEFAARIEGYMQSFTRAARWSLGRTFYGITGTAGRVAQLWVIPPRDSRRVEAQLQKAPWLRGDVLERPPTFEILRASPSDPDLDPGRDTP